jgi:hypothetical protein
MLAKRLANEQRDRRRIRLFCSSYPNEGLSSHHFVYLCSGRHHETAAQMAGRVWSRACSHWGIERPKPGNSPTFVSHSVNTIPHFSLAHCRRVSFAAQSQFLKERGSGQSDTSFKARGFHLASRTVTRDELSVAISRFPP